jgi:hypothetical protein
MSHLPWYEGLFERLPDLGSLSNEFHHMDDTYLHLEGKEVPLGS